MVKVKSFIEKFYVAFIGFLLYAPLLVLLYVPLMIQKQEQYGEGLLFTGTQTYFRMRKYFQQ